MVSVTSDERTVGECSEWSTLVLTLLICQECWIIDTSIETFLIELSDSEWSLWGICKSIIHKKKVIYAPHSLICQRTEAGLEH